MTPPMQDVVPSVSLLGPLSAFMASFTWAVGSIGYTRLSREHTPFAINFARASVALPLFVLLACIVSGGGEGAIRAYASIPLRDLGWLAISILASYGLGDVFFMWSARSLGIPAALAISSTYPILTALWGAIAQGEWLRMRQSAGLSLAVAGVVAVILSHRTVRGADRNKVGSTLRAESRKGVLLAFGAMVSWAFNSIGTSRGAQHVHFSVANSFRMTFALAMTALFGLLATRRASKSSRTPFSVTLPWPVLKKALPLCLFEAFGGSAFFAYGLSHSSLAAGATLSSLAPVLSVPLAWLMGAESFSLRRTLGVCVTAGGLWMLLL